LYHLKGIDQEKKNGSELASSDVDNISFDLDLASHQLANTGSSQSEAELL
jgi:hypothetical protein